MFTSTLRRSSKRTFCKIQENVNKKSHEEMVQKQLDQKKKLDKLVLSNLRISTATNIVTCCTIITMILIIKTR